MTNPSQPEFRVEQDSMGEVEVPADALYHTNTASCGQFSFQ